MKTNNCYGCKWRRDIPGDAHSECVNPHISPQDKLLAPIMLMAGMIAPVMKRLNVRGNETGIKNGWFMWPLNFDPTWLESCDGFEAKEDNENETTRSD